MVAPERMAPGVWMGCRDRPVREVRGEPTELKGVKVPQVSRAQPGRGGIQEHLGLRVLWVRWALLEPQPSHRRQG